jgi:hypothetical protein
MIISRSTYVNWTWEELLEDQYTQPMVASLLIGKEHRINGTVCAAVYGPMLSKVSLPF